MIKYVLLYKFHSPTIWLSEEEAEELKLNGVPVYKVHFDVPKWAERLGLNRCYNFFRNIFNFRNPLDMS